MKRLSFILLVLYLFSFNSTVFSLDFVKRYVLSPQSITEDTYPIIKTILNNEHASISLNSQHYALLKDIITKKIDKLLLTIEEKQQLDLLTPQVIIGSSEDNPKDWEDLTTFLQSELQFSIKRSKSVFPRDSFTIISGKKYKLMESNLSEGGAIVWSDLDRFAIFSTSIPNQDIRKFVNETGYKAYYVESPPHNHHIDTKIGIIDRFKVLVIDPRYYNEQKTAIDIIASKENYDIALVADSEVVFNPANLIGIDSNLYILNQAPETLKNISKVTKIKLRELMRYIKICPHKNNTYFLVHGIRCMTNVNYELLDYLLSQENWRIEEIESFIIIFNRFYKDIRNSIKQNKDINSIIIDYIINEFLLKSIIVDIYSPYRILRLKDLKENFSKLGYHKAVLRISQILDGEEMVENHFTSLLFPELLKMSA